MMQIQWKLHREVYGTQRSDTHHPSPPFPTTASLDTQLVLIMALLFFADQPVICFAMFRKDDCHSILYMMKVHLKCVSDVGDGLGTI